MAASNCISNFAMRHALAVAFTVLAVLAAGGTNAQKREPNARQKEQEARELRQEMRRARNEAKIDEKRDGQDQKDQKKKQNKSTKGNAEPAGAPK